MLLMTLTLIASLLPCTQVQGTAEVSWETDLDVAVERARETDRPLLIVFR